MIIKSVLSLYPCKSLIQNRQLTFVLPLLLLAACTGTPKDDGTSLPPPLYQQPQTIPAHPEGGYAINLMTGDSIKPIINSFGDTLITGVPIPTQGKRIHPESVAKPKMIITPMLGSQKKYIAHNNRYMVPEHLPIFPVDQSKLTKKTVTQIAKGDTTHYIINSTGQKVLTGVPILAKGKKVPSKNPQPNQALPPAKKDATIANIQYMDVRQGMASYVIWSIIEDRNGNLWFCNETGGVSKYDGQSFTHFTEKEGLSNNKVVSIVEDKNGNLWFGTDRGVNKYDGKSFTHFTENEGLSNNLVESIIEDKNGNLWFGTAGGGVCKYDPSEDGTSGTFTHFTEKEGLSNNIVMSIVEDQIGHLWFGTEGGGVNKYDGKSFTHFTEKEGLSNNSVVSILEDKNGNLWFGTEGGGVNKYDGQSLPAGQVSFTHFTVKEGLSNNTVRSIAEDKSGNLWFGTAGGGVCKYDPSEDGTSGTFTHFTEKEGLSNNTVRSIAEDNSGNLWFGTVGGGVNKYDGKSFSHFNEKDGLTNNLVRSIFEDKSGNLWVGTNGGVSKYDGQYFTSIEGLNNKIVLSILEDKSGNLWFSTLNHGVSKYDARLTARTGSGGNDGVGQGKTLPAGQASLTEYTINEGLSNIRVYTIFEDKSGNLWFGTNGGVSKYDPDEDGTSGTFTHFTEKEGLSNNRVYTILEDIKGNLWFGTFGGGVSKYDPDEDGTSGTFTHFTEKEGLSNNKIWAITEDQNGNLWFGTDGGGINKYDPDEDGTSGTFTHFTEKEGLSNNIVKSIVEDKNGHLWFGTFDGGVNKYDGKSFIYFNENDGLNNYVTSLVEDKNQNLWFGTYGGGVSKMDKDVFQPLSQPLSVHLRQLYINETLSDYSNLSDNKQDIKFDSVQSFENYPINPRLSSGQNHLSFQYSAIDWAAPAKIKYSFRLLGLDNKWSNPSAKTLADYRNLPDGKFTFQVRAIGNSGKWSKAFEYPFTILPPWWKTWWAYTIYTLLFLAALRTFSLWRERNLRQEKEQLKQMVDERTIELKTKSEQLEHSLDNLKSTQAQLIQSEKMASLGELTAGIAHEIQNPLNFVNNFSEVSVDLANELKEEAEKAEIDKELIIDLATDLSQNQEKINHHGKRASDIVKGMLEHSRKSSGEKKATDINALCDEYFRLAYHGIKAKNNNFNATMETHFDPNLPKINIIPQDIGRVMLNLINNAFYAVNEKSKVDNQKSGLVYEPCVTVSTRYLGDKIEIRVMDNGNGIPDSIKDKIFQPFFTTKPAGQGTGLGLSLAFDIITLGHGGTIKADSTLGSSTEFTITLPVQ